MQFLLQEIASFISLISKRANLTGRYYKYNLHIGIGDPVFENTADTIALMSVGFRFWRQRFWILHPTDGSSSKESVPVEQQLANSQIGSSTSQLIHLGVNSHEPKSTFCHP